MMPYSLAGGYQPLNKCVSSGFDCPLTKYTRTHDGKTIHLYISDILATTAYLFISDMPEHVTYI